MFKEESIVAVGASSRTQCQQAQRLEYFLYKYTLCTGFNNGKSSLYIYGSVAFGDINAGWLIYHFGWIQQRLSGQFHYCGDDNPSESTGRNSLHTRLIIGHIQQVGDGTGNFRGMEEEQLI